MYKCLECGEVFNDYTEFEKVTEDYGETFDCCPYCHGAYEEAKSCDHCGEYFAESELKIGDDMNYYCEECYEELFGGDE